MRVAHVLYSGLGGHGAVFFSLVRAPSSFDVEHFPVFFGVEPLRPEYLELCHTLELQHATIQKRAGHHFGPQFELLKALTQLDPDALIIHSSPCLLAARVYRWRRPGTPILFVEHQPNHQKTKSEWLASALAPWVCNKVIYLTEESRAEAHEKLGPFYRPSRAEVISNGIDTDLFHPKKRQSRGKRFCVGMAARMTDLKDQESLIYAINLASETVDDLYLELAGDGPTKTRLEELSRSLGLEDKVSFLGMLDEAELVSFYQGLDLYVHSTHGETMSTSIMQAQACGLPLVASNVRGVNNHVLSECDGLLSPPCDPRTLAHQILRLRAEASTCDAFGVASRKKAVEMYSRTSMRDRYDRILQECMRTTK